MAMANAASAPLDLQVEHFLTVLGLATVSAHDAEVSLRVAYAAARFSHETAPESSGDEASDTKAAQDLLRTAESLTAGQLLKGYVAPMTALVDARAPHAFPTLNEIEAALADAVAKRNRMTHHLRDLGTGQLGSEEWVATATDTLMEWTNVFLGAQQLAWRLGGVADPLAE